MRTLAVVAAVVAAMAGAGCDPPVASCQALKTAQRWAEAVPVCRDAFVRRGDPVDGVRLAAALAATERYRELGPIGERLRGTRFAADGAYYEGLAALDAQDPTRAARLFEEAMRGHHAREAWREAAHAGHQLMGLQIKAGRYHAATETGAMAADDALRSGDRTMLGYLAMARADVARRIGDLAAAQRALDEALALVRGQPDEERWLHFKLGVVHLDAGRVELAAEHLRWVLERTPAGARGARALLDGARLNLAWLAADRGRLDEAERLLAAVPLEGAPSSTRVALAFGTAQIAAARGELAAAAALLDDAERLPLTDEWIWVVPLERGRVAVRLGDPAGAEAAFERAIDAIEHQRTGVGDESIYLDAHRAPYYELFALHARAGRWDRALAQVIALEDGDLLDAVGDLRWDASAGPTRRGALRAALPASDEASRIAALRAVSREHDLVIAIAAGGELWRVELRAGKVTGTAVARAAELPPLIDAVIADPGDAVATSRLGALLVPPGRTERPLYLAPLGELARVPLAALRHDGRLVIADRPLVRMVSFTPAPPAPAGAPGEPLVLARGANLKAADDEARDAAAALGTEAHRGDDATAARLLAATGPIVHVASHAGVDDRGAYLELDRPVHAAEIAAASWSASRLVVLASCGSAAARDAQGRGSLASAFVDGGARAVLATYWSVGDASTRRLLRAFYQAGGARDPARALAAAQVALATELDDRQWTAFAVLAAPPPLTRH